MFLIKNNSEAVIIEKKSKFITRLFKIKTEEEISAILKETRKKEKGAVHNCYAYRILSNKKTVIERKNDDGEPGGTAGAPMLAVLTGQDLINILVVTTRYFGGIKLGTGGLVNVYKRGVKEALKANVKIEFALLGKWEIIFPINNIKHADYLLKKSKINIIEKKFIDKKVFYIIEAPEEQEIKINDIIGKIQGVIAKKEEI